MDLDEGSYDGLMTGRTGPVVVQSERRRNWSDEQKLLIVQESLRPGVVVAQVARRWAIGSGQLYTWRKQLLSAAAGSFVPCEIIGDRGQPRCGIAAVSVDLGVRGCDGGSRRHYRGCRKR